MTDWLAEARKDPNYESNLRAALAAKQASNPFADIYADHAERMEAQVAKRASHMSDNDIAAQIKAITARRRETLYHLKYSTSETLDDDADMLALLGEQDRRKRVASTQIQAA